MSNIVYRDGDQINEPDDLFSKIIIKVKGHDDQVLESYRKFVSTTCIHLDVELTSTVRSKPYIDRFVLNSCPFIHKKTFKEYEIRTHEHSYTLWQLTGCTASVILEYIQRNLPEGVGMSVEKHRVEAIPDHILKIANSPSLENPTD